MAVGLKVDTMKIILRWVLLLVDALIQYINVSSSDSSTKKLHKYLLVIKQMHKTLYYNKFHVSSTMRLKHVAAYNKLIMKQDFVY